MPTPQIVDQITYESRFNAGAIARRSHRRLSRIAKGQLTSSARADSHRQQAPPRNQLDSPKIDDLYDPVVLHSPLRDSCRDVGGRRALSYRAARSTRKATARSVAPYHRSTSNKLSSRKASLYPEPRNVR